MLSRLLGGERRQATTYSPTAFLAQLLVGGPTKAGVNVSETSALALPTVYACIRVLAESVASLPLVLYEKQGRNRKPAETDPRYRLLHDQPADGLTSFVWRELVMSHLAGFGNHYSLIVSTRGGRVVELRPLHPMQVTPRLIGGRRVYDYTPANGGAQVTLMADEVLHIQGISYDGLMGWSPIRMHREAIGWGLATQDFSSQFFGNGAQVRGVLKHPGTVPDPDKMRTQWENAYGGENRLKVAVLTQGMEYQQISVSPDDAQFVQTRALQVAEICRIFNVPPVLVQDFGRATWSNAEHSDLAFVKHTLLPWLSRIEATLNAALLTEAEQTRMFFKFTVQALLRGDNAGRATFYQSGITNGWLTRNEAREKEDLDPLDGLDEPLMPTSAAQPAAPAAAPPADPPQHQDQPGDPTQDPALIRQAQDIALLAAGRVLQRELRVLRAARAADSDTGGFLSRAEYAYEDLGDYLVSALGASAEARERWRAARWRDLTSSEPVEITLTRWAEQGPAAILELIR